MYELELLIKLLDEDCFCDEELMLEELFCEEELAFDERFFSVAEDEDFLDVLLLALDEELLDALHKNLRRMMEQSPLMDAKRYIREVEARYEEIWKKWRTGES